MQFNNVERGIYCIQGASHTIGSTTYTAKMELCGIGVDFYKSYKTNKENIINIALDYDVNVKTEMQ